MDPNTEIKTCERCGGILSFAQLIGAGTVRQCPGCEGCRLTVFATGGVQK